MLKIWGRPNSINVQKVMWAVGELGLEHERVDAGGAFGVVDTDDYAAINPNRLIPTLEDGDFALWESNVIVRYLAAKHDTGGLWPRDAEQRAVADQWMEWQQTLLALEMRTVFWGLVRTQPEKRDAAAIAAGVEALKPIWTRLEQHLEGRAFVAGDALTMGDIPVGAMFHRYHALGVERGPDRNLLAWYQRLVERPAFREHVMLPLS